MTCPGVGWRLPLATGTRFTQTTSHTLLPPGLKLGWLEQEIMNTDAKFATIFTCMELPATEAGPPMTSKAVTASGAPTARQIAAVFIAVFTIPIVEGDDHYQQEQGCYSGR